MFSRYRSYTTYSEENGKLVPSIEPMEKGHIRKMSEEEKTAKNQINIEKKLNEGQPTQIVTVNK